MQVATRFVKCRSWLVKMTVPSYSSRASARASTVSTSRWLPGSSRINTLWSLSNSPARQSRARSPPDSTEMGFLILLAAGRLLVQVLQNGLALREAGVHVLGVDADLTAVPPADLPCERLE